MAANNQKPPFEVGEIVICHLDYMTLRYGSKCRVLEITASDKCGSGWRVTVAHARHRGNVFAGEGIDSDWFTADDGRTALAKEGE